MYDQLSKNILKLPEVSKERREILTPLIQYIEDKIAGNKPINLNFICTHNSRRSHLAQIWAQTMAYKFKIKNFYSYSGGTEITRINTTIIKTLIDFGFKVQELSENNNPIYAIKYNDNELPVIGFSKKYDSEFNPVSEFGAIMTCSQADGGCPFINGAEKRFSVTFNDPKAYDNTPLEKEKYADACLLIASEMNYVFSSIKK
ncbi:protein-tyrosine-phosphatase [Tenacibaculum insulae]|uniref:protein-tyrosine-phosphatase n=1 Tax=Tenacibaculum insulae TaxID=2029677 RepID=UPI003AB79CDF